MADDQKPRALVLLADGAEEMEAVITIDVLRRAEIEVVVAGLDGRRAATCSRGVVLTPDRALKSVGGTFDVVVLPGGAGGAEKLAADEAVGELLREQREAGRWIAAICAAPIALARHGVGAGVDLTSHPSVAEEVGAHGNYLEMPVVEDDRIVTSRGPGTAFDFALQLTALLRDEETAASLRAPMMLPPPVEAS